MYLPQRKAICFDLWKQMGRCAQRAEKLSKRKRSMTDNLLINGDAPTSQPIIPFAPGFQEALAVFEGENEDMIPFAEAEDRLAMLEARLHEAEELLVMQDRQFEEAFSDMERLEERLNEAADERPYLNGQIAVLSRQVSGLYFGIGVSAMLWLITVINK
jgi:hypothetical protein